MSTVITNDDDVIEVDVEPEESSSEVAEPTSSESRRSFGVSPKWFATNLLPPVLGVGVFLLLWAVLAPRVNTSLGALPGPGEVLEAGRGLWSEYRASQAEEAGQEIAEADATCHAAC